MNQVIILQELLAQYRVPFYEQLRGILAKHEVDLRLIHGHARSSRALYGDESAISWAETVHNRYLPFGRSRQALTWQPVIRRLGSADLVIVEHASRLLINPLLILSRRLRRSPAVAFWGHGANLQATNTEALSERYKRWLASKADWWFAYTEGSAERVAATGFPIERITVVQNAIDASEYSAADKEKKDPCACVFLGSLHEYKRIQFLLDAGRHIASQLPGFRLTVIGDGPLRPLVERSAASESWLDYRGRLSGSSKAQLTARASLCLMPGLVGLAVVDTFAAETPMVTINLPFHSPEFEYVEHNHNAMVLPEDVTASQYGDAVAALLVARGEVNRLRAGCRASAAVITIAEMTRRYATGVVQALKAVSEPRR